MSNVNLELLDLALNYIDEHPEEWDQSTWDCGTTACIAGHMARIAGSPISDKFLATSAGYLSNIIEKVTGLPDSHGLFTESNNRNVLGVWRDILAGERVNAMGLDLQLADFSGADLSYADLRGADLSDADLRGADLSHADLRGADLSHAILYRATLRGADLRGAVVDHVHIGDTDLTGVNMEGVFSLD